MVAHVDDDASIDLEIGDEDEADEDWDDEDNVFSDDEDNVFSDDEEKIRINIKTDCVISVLDTLNGVLSGNRCKNCGKYVQK